MKAWVMTEIYDDSDPGDKASLSKVRVFLTLQAARDAFWTEQARFTKDQRGYMTVDCDPDDLKDDFGPDAPPEVEEDELLDWANEQAMKEPEKYTWTNGRSEDGWDGGSIVEFSEVDTE